MRWASDQFHPHAAAAQRPDFVGNGLGWSEGRYRVVTGFAGLSDVQKARLMSDFPNDVFDEQRRAAEAAYLEARARHERLIHAFGIHLADLTSDVKAQVEELLRARAAATEGPASR